MAKVFISHSWEDNHIAKKIAENLRRDGAEIWIDYANIKGGDQLPVRISKALEWCDTLVLLWSKSAADSYYVGLEWQGALDLQKRIIPSLIDDTRRPGILHGFLYINFKDFDKGYELLLQALDLKREKPTKPPRKPVEQVPSKKVQPKQKIMKIISLFVAITIIGIGGIFLLQKFLANGTQQEQKIAEPKSNEDSLKTYWASWQTKMNDSYLQALKRDENTNFAASYKAQSWQDFLNNYPDDNLFSQKDNDHRSNAINRRDYWRKKATQDSIYTVDKAYWDKRQSEMNGGWIKQLQKNK